VNVISKRGLAELIDAGKFDRDTRNELTDWYLTARAASWLRLADVQRQFPATDQVGRVPVFDIRHNRYRLITRVDFRKQKLYIKALLTHKAYDRKEWKKGCKHSQPC
jgi:mRNA interferase HigB